MQLIIDAGKLAKAIAKHGATRSKLKLEGHMLALSCVRNAMISGNAELMNRLVDSSDYAKASMTKWGIANKFFVHVAKSKDKPAHLAVNKDTRAKFVQDDKLKNEEHFTQMLLALQPYYEFDPPKEYKPFKLLAKLKAVQREIKSVQENEERAALDNDFTGARELAALIANLEIENIKAANQIAA